MPVPEKWWRKPDPDPWRGLQDIFEDVAGPVIHVDGLPATFHQDLVRLKAIEQIASTIAADGVQKEIRSVVDHLAEQVSAEAGALQVGA